MKIHGDMNMLVRFVPANEADEVVPILWKAGVSSLTEPSPKGSSCLVLVREHCERFQLSSIINTSNLLDLFDRALVFRTPGLHAPFHVDLAKCAAAQVFEFPLPSNILSGGSFVAMRAR